MSADMIRMGAMLIGFCSSSLGMTGWLSCDEGQVRQIHHEQRMRIDSAIGIIVGVATVVVAGLPDLLA